jgi:RND family efflux transporter MFP subunit
MRSPLFLCLFFVTLAACTGGGADAPTGGKPGGPVVVRLAVARAETLPTALEFTGTLSGGEEVTVSAEVEAAVAEIVADMGDRVAAGDPLVRLNVEDLRLRAEQAEAEFQQARARLGTEPGHFAPERAAAVRRAQADLEETRRELTRGEELRRREVSAPADLESLRTRVTQAEAALQSALEDARAAAATADARRAAADLARKRLRDAVIRAPIAGAVSRRLVAPGEYVKIGQAVARVVVTDPLKLQGEVPERHAGAVRTGLPVTVSSEALAGQSLTGTLTRVSPEVSVSTRTFTVEARLSDPEGRWKPGMFARASIQLGTTEDVFAVPETAVSNQAGVTKVFVEQDAKASAREVRLVRKRGSDALVTGPLKDGERIIVSGVARLFDGADVKVDAGAGPPSAGPASAGK